MTSINDEWAQYLSMQDSGNISQILAQESKKATMAKALLDKKNEGINTNASCIDDAIDPNINVPKCEDLYISTKTKVLFLNQEIDIQRIFWKYLSWNMGKYQKEL